MWKRAPAHRLLAEVKRWFPEARVYSGELGVTESTLSLWADGKCIGAPEFTIGVATPLTCAAIAAYKRQSKVAEQLTRVEDATD